MPCGRTVQPRLVGRGAAPRINSQDQAARNRGGGVGGAKEIEEDCSAGRKYNGAMFAGFSSCVPAGGGNATLTPSQFTLLPWQASTSIHTIPRGGSAGAFSCSEEVCWTLLWCDAWQS